jgi:hypothetical protein
MATTAVKLYDDVVPVGHSVSMVAYDRGHYPDRVWKLDANEEIRRILENVDTINAIGRALPIKLPRLNKKVVTLKPDQKYRFTCKGDPKRRCPYCDEELAEGEARHLVNPDGPGTNRENRPKLVANILEHSGLGGIDEHRWYVGHHSLAGHHLICCAAMKNETWHQICADSGYDINCWQNGIMLPMLMDLACQLHVPLHRGPHDKGRGGEDKSLSYPAAVKEELEGMLIDISEGEFCKNPAALVDGLNNVAHKICKEISVFEWTLTRDGADYMYGGIGCGGMIRISGKYAGGRRRFDLRCAATPERQHWYVKGGLSIIKGSDAAAVGCLTAERSGNMLIEKR